MSKLILGSKSPRRKELLEKAGFQFEQFTKDVNEDYPEDLPLSEIAEYLSSKKNDAYRKSLNDEIIITADTIVLAEDHMLGKPSNEAEAMKMLAMLSGITHQVITGVTITSPSYCDSWSVKTDVKVKPLKRKEIDYYIKNFKPFDKAGAYGIQEWFGIVCVEWIKGSYYNVVGLPIDSVAQSLTEHFDISPY